ncbi:hypothetical protein SDC9_136136 [bioreactor metagenome]|uniref:Uncharacterized protein n=1 Tax=bioreactor metagenome TaxID=1076179 RepID=A0A645DJ17_9ZZZZ
MPQAPLLDAHHHVAAAVEEADAAALRQLLMAQQKLLEPFLRNGGIVRPLPVVQKNFFRSVLQLARLGFRQVGGAHVRGVDHQVA